MNRKTRRLCGVVLLVAAGGFAMMNVLAYWHAHTMMHFTPGGTRTRKPEELSFGEKAKLLFTGVNMPRPRGAATPSSVDLPFEEHMIACRGGPRLCAWYVPCKDSRALVVMFHGYTADKSGMLAEARAFHDLGYSTFLVDFRGSGGSSESYTTVGYDEATDVGEAARYARAHFDSQRIVLFGQSMGAAAILRAIHVQEVNPDAIVLEAVFDTMLNAVKNRFRLMSAPSFPAAQFLIFWGGWQAGFNGFKHNPVDYASSVTCPVLFLQGTRDPRARPEEARRVYDRIGSRREFVEISGARHESYVRRWPEGWKKAIAGFMESAGQAQAPAGAR